ncbi:helix-turn-helix transcriptional regulator [Candidatus Woesebacteria bacterium]|nr:helix-turn-helix transcriptional regulator [Candidatus Woesebacteria bacterium]
MEVTLLFHALGDPIRLEMVRRLASGQAHTLSSVSQNLKITRQGARKHLQILADAHIIALKQKGRTTEVRLLRDTLDQGRSFIASLEKAWDTRLQNLKRIVEG